MKDITSNYNKKIHTATDDELLVDARNGNKRAFGKLVTRYEKKIYNLAYRITGNFEDASDIFQDTFAQAFRKLSTFKGESKFATWLYRIAVNLSLMKKRKDKKRYTYSLDETIFNVQGDVQRQQLRYDWSETPLDKLEHKELSEMLNKAISKLPPKYKAALVLRDINGLSNKEVANILDISLASTKSRIHRARLLLREKLTKYFKDTKGKNGKH
jgi:RNA polymerase sigma-70 factor (ECF subfamily)